jgi:hypothetical protein
LSHPNLVNKKDYWNDRVKPKLDMVTGWARNGLSNAQIALNLGIGESTFGVFLQKHEELQDALYLGRRDAEIVVENAMFKRAIGYKYNEVTRERCKVFDENGQWTGQWEMRIVKKVTKHVLPDVQAQQYWLEHRAPKRWERHPTPGLDPNAINEGIQSLAKLLKTPLPERQIGCEEDGE